MARAISRLPSAVIPRGFSTNMCLPAWAAAATSSGCRSVSEQMTTPWTSGSEKISSRLVATRA